jgi:hypothetical protein
MFLKLLAPSSIIVVACTGLLNMFINVLNIHQKDE